MIHTALYSIDVLTLILLLIAFSIFALIAVRSKNVRTFQFQMSIFIVVWILGEAANTLQVSGIILLRNLQNFGMQIHAVSMVFFGIMLWLRFYYSERAGKKLVDTIDNEDNSR
jgi:Zn-dependent membrane protease YugP